MADLNHPSPEEKNKNVPPVAVNATGNGGTGTSIGPGTSDQGFEPGEEKRDDEFRNNNYKETILDKENVTHSAPPTHGLVEEGPGPDA